MDSLRPPQAARKLSTASAGSSSASSSASASASVAQHSPAPAHPLPLPPGTFGAASSSSAPQSAGANAPAFYGLYSDTGFDLLKVLSKVVYRPNPKIELGPIDLSCSFLVADATLEDQPIIYASESFERLTGYRSEEVRGKNCRFLQAPNGQVEKGRPRQFADSKVCYDLKLSISKFEECQFININYKKSGEPFINLISVIPVPSDDNSHIQYFVGFQVDLMQQSMAILGRIEDPIISPDVAPNLQRIPNAARSEILSLFFNGSKQTEDLETISPSTLQLNPFVPPSALMLGGVTGVATEEPQEVDDGNDNGFDRMWSRTTTGTSLGSSSSSAGAAPTHLQTISPTATNLYAFDPTSTENGISEFFPTTDVEQVVREGPALVTMLSSRGLVLFASDACKAWLDYAPTELVGRSLSDVAHTGDAIGLLRELKAHGAAVHVAAGDDNDDAAPASRTTASPVSPVVFNTPALENNNNSINPTTHSVFRLRARNGTFVWVAAAAHQYAMPNRKRTKCFVLTLNRVEPPLFSLPARLVRQTEDSLHARVAAWLRVSRAGFILANYVAHPFFAEGSNILELTSLANDAVLLAQTIHNITSSTSTSQHAPEATAVSFTINGSDLSALVLPCTPCSVFVYVSPTPAGMAQGIAQDVVASGPAQQQQQQSYRWLTDASMQLNHEVSALRAHNDKLRAALHGR